MSRKGHDGLYKVPTIEESERDQIKFIELRFERWQVVRFRKAGRRQDVSYVRLTSYNLYCVYTDGWEALQRLALLTFEMPAN